MAKITLWRKWCLNVVTIISCQVMTYDDFKSLMKDDFLTVGLDLKSTLR